jgi:hypothetical protein
MCSVSLTQPLVTMIKTCLIIPHFDAATEAASRPVPSSGIAPQLPAMFMRPAIDMTFLPYPVQRLLP